MPKHSKSYLDMSKKSQRGGATNAIREDSRYEELKPWERERLDKVLATTKARNTAKTRKRAPFNFTKDVKQAVARTYCDCGALADQFDHKVSIDYKLGPKNLKRVLAHFQVPESMTVQDFMRSVYNCNNVCGKCNKAKEKRMKQMINNGFDLIEFLILEEKAAEAKRANEKTYEANQRFSKEEQRIKQKIRSSSKEKLNENTINQYRYKELSELHERWAIMIQHYQEYATKTDFRKLAAEYNKNKT